MKKWTAVFYAVLMSLFVTNATVLGAASWSDGRFGYGDTVTRAQFATMLACLFEWDDTVETESALFRPSDAITREEMAVMLVQALGYQELSKELTGISMPFTDVTTNREFIAMAYDFRLISGTSATTFSPREPATREQAVAVMNRLYEKLHSDDTFLHGFYAVSSYSQKDVIPLLDAVSFGWSQMAYIPDIGPVLNTTRSPQNEYGIPNGYEEVVDLAKTSGTKAHLSVYMDVLDGSAQIILNQEVRLKAVAQIVAELKQRPHYSGVTIDFEQLRGAEMRSGFTAFLTALRAELEPLGLSLYVCVHPATSDNQYFDGYDYRAIGDLADRVILMAHDYAAKSLTEAEQAAGFVWTPVTPIKEIYYALRAITDSNTGVLDCEKILLAISFGSVQWETPANGVTRAKASQPAPVDIYKRMIQPGTDISYAVRYENPYMTYSDANGSTHMIWYEDERSVQAKEELARMFGITGVSLWRLGLIPSYPQPAEKPLYYDVLAELYRFREQLRILPSLCDFASQNAITGEHSAALVTRHNAIVPTKAVSLYELTIIGKNIRL